MQIKKKWGKLKKKKSQRQLECSTRYKVRILLAGQNIHLYCPVMLVNNLLNKCQGTIVTLLTFRPKQTYELLRRTPGLGSTHRVWRI